MLMLLFVECVMYQKQTAAGGALSELLRMIEGRGCSSVWSKVILTKVLLLIVEFGLPALFFSLLVFPRDETKKRSDLALQKVLMWRLERCVVVSLFATTMRNRYRFTRYVKGSFGTLGIWYTYTIYCNSSRVGVPLTCQGVQRTGMVVYCSMDCPSIGIEPP